MSDEILSRMLENVKAAVNKQEGSFTYDALSPVALELAQMLLEIERAKAIRFSSDVSGDDVDLKVSEQGLTRKVAEKASGTVYFTGTAGTVVPAGTAVSTSAGTNFLTEIDVTIPVSGVLSGVSITALVSGVAGNVAAGLITQCSAPGISSVTNLADVSGGANVESDESLLSRYYLELREQPSSSNPAHYKKLAREIPGIADARIFRAWSGPGTVKVVLLGEDKRTPGVAAISAAASLINENIQIGEGAITVVGVTEVQISISAVLTLKTTGVLTDAIEQIRAAVGDYLRGLAFTDLIVRYNKLGESILNAPDVLDWSNLTVNGGSGNIELQQDQVPVMGAVNMTLGA